MKKKTRIAIDELLDLRDDCTAQLEERINRLIVTIEQNQKLNADTKIEIRALANHIKDWMSSCHYSINKSVDSILDSLKWVAPNKILFK